VSRSESAVECFNNGCNCAQAVFISFCEELGLDKKFGLKLACPFGGGMGHTGGACGAVTGALLVIGLKYGPESSESGDIKVVNYKIVQDFISRFKGRNGSANCTELIGYDLSDETRLNLARQAGVFKTKCPKYVSDAVEILESILFEFDIRNKQSSPSEV
jgi:C_GCAxxG_C_C family probable redox protein